jgi:hypothetical protein
MKFRTKATEGECRSTQAGVLAQRSLRARIAAAFRKIARGVDERTAQAQTQAFYRSSRAPWARWLG